MSKNVERLWPYVAALAVVVIWFAAGQPFPTTPDGLFGASATVASVFASFLGVSKAIILAIKPTPTYQLLKDLGYTTDLFGYLRSGIVALVAFAGLSILGFFVDPKRVIDGYPIFVCFQFAWVGAAAVSLFTYARISGILFKVLKAA